MSASSTEHFLKIIDGMRGFGLESKQYIDDPKLNPGENDKHPTNDLSVQETRIQGC